MWGILRNSAVFWQALAHVPKEDRLMTSLIAQRVCHLWGQEMEAAGKYLPGKYLPGGSHSTHLRWNAGFMNIGHQLFVVQSDCSALFFLCVTLGSSCSLAQRNRVFSL